MAASLVNQAPQTTFLKLEYPAPRVILMTMSREKDYNCANAAAVVEMTDVFQWFDSEPSLTVAILTGAGKKAFSTGADLKEWNASKKSGSGGPASADGLSNRKGTKPIIAAVNGMAIGGGCEILVNCDLVIASETATFALPEVTRGLAPHSGVLPRLIRTVGLQRASEFALTGKRITAQLAQEWGLVNKVVKPDELIPEAVEWARKIGEISPDSIICTRSMLREGWTTADVVEATNISNAREWAELQKGENLKEGLRAFSEKRKPVWTAPRL